MDRELEKELYDIFEGFLNSLDFKYHYEDSDGNVVDYPKKETTKTCDCKKQDHSPKIKVADDKQKVIEELKKLLSEKYKEIDSLKKKNEELLELSKQGSVTSHNMFEEGKRQRDLIKKRVYADGYRLISEIKSYIEYARECELLNDANFAEPFGTMRKTLNDFAELRKPYYGFVNNIPGRLS